MSGDGFIDEINARLDRLEQSRPSNQTVSLNHWTCGDAIDYIRPPLPLTIVTVAGFLSLICVAGSLSTVLSLAFYPRVNSPIPILNFLCVRSLRRQSRER